jgi:hypothetical protein
MSEYIVKPRKSPWEKVRDWCKSWSPQVKQAVITGVILIVLTVVGWLWFSTKRTSEVNRSANIAATNGSGSPLVQGNGHIVNIDNSTHAEPQNDFASLASLDAFLLHLERLKSRFAEYDDYTKRVVGTPISWDGLVSGVSSSGDDVCLTLRSPPKRFSCSTLVYFPNAFRIRLYALKEGDAVRISGLIKEADITHILISATNFWLNGQ